MATMSSIIRRLSEIVSGLTVTWLAIQVPGEYAHASAWLMPTVAAFFAFAVWFALAFRGMAPSIALVGKPSGADQQRSDHLGMAAVFDSVGRVCVGAGVLSAVIQTLASPTHCSWEFPVAMGAGIWIGIKAQAKVPV